MTVVEKVAHAIRFAENPLDGDPIGVMIHTYDFLPTDGGLDAQIAEVDKVCAVMARAALTTLLEPSEAMSMSGDRVLCDPGYDAKDCFAAMIQAALDEK